MPGDVGACESELDVGDAFSFDEGVVRPIVVPPPVAGVSIAAPATGMRDEPKVAVDVDVGTSPLETSLHTNWTAGTLSEMDQKQFL